MQVNNAEDALFWWLEELPVNELECQRAQEIVSCFRNGLMDVMEASHLLEQDCEGSIKEWINNNKTFGSLLS